MPSYEFRLVNVLAEQPLAGNANLGGWLLETQHELPVSLVISQGAQTGCPCTLRLHVDASRQIFVTGRVIDIGRGTINL